MDLFDAKKRAGLCLVTLGVAVAMACRDGRSAAGPTLGGTEAAGATPQPTMSSGAAGTGTSASAASAARGFAGQAAAAAGSGASHGKPNGEAGSTMSGSDAGVAMAAAGAPTAGMGASVAGAGGMVGSPAAGMASAGTACDPADKTAPPTPASFKFITGYGSLAKEPTTGPNKPVLEVHAGFPEWTVYRPDPLGSEDLHAIMIWAEGGCLQNSTIQGPALLELASWGFVVLADGKPQDNNTGADPAASGIRSGPAAEPMIKAMDWITAENERPCSPFYHKLDVAKIGTGGQSCGGMMTLLSADDKRVTTAVVSNSGVSGNNTMLFASYHAPMLFMAGGSSDFLSSSATANVNAINKVPIWYGNMNVGHGATWEATNGGEFGRVMLGWLQWKLRGDSAAEKMFVGSDCELCKPPSQWTIVKKMID